MRAGAKAVKSQTVLQQCRFSGLTSGLEFSTRSTLFLFPLQNGLNCQIMFSFETFSVAITTQKQINGARLTVRTTLVLPACACAGSSPCWLFLTPPLLALAGPRSGQMECVWGRRGSSCSVRPRCLSQGIRVTHLERTR